MEPSTQVIIAGAGPVGLALALGLSQYGIRSVVFEADATLSIHSKAPAVHARTLEILRAWGVVDRFLSAGTFLSTPEAWLTGESRPSARVDFSVLDTQSAFAGVLVLPQNRTEALLAERAQELGFAELRFGSKVTGFQQDEAGVTVSVEPLEGDPYEVRGDYLIGCDGAHSQVRATLGWELEGKTYPSRAMLADVTLPDDRNDLPWPRLAFVEGGFLAGLKIEAHLWRIISLVRPGESDEVALGDERLKQQVAALFGDGSFERVWSSAFHLHCRTSPRFRLGRVLLAGDAAHLNSPAGGQGMNSGIQDAHNLAWKLARALSGGDVDSLLGSYECERRAAILSNVDRFTDLLTRVGLLAWPRSRSILGKVVPFALRQRLVLEQLAPKLSMLDVHYPRSPLLTGGGRMLGQRAPDVQLRDPQGQSIRLLELVGNQPLLLLFDDGKWPRWDPDAVLALCEGAQDVRIVRLLTSWGAPESGGYRDASGELWRMWQATGSLAVLIRPDGIVGWEGERPAPDDIRAGVRRALGHR